MLCLCAYIHIYVYMHALVSRVMYDGCLVLALMTHIHARSVPVAITHVVAVSADGFLAASVAVVSFWHARSGVFILRHYSGLRFPL